MKLFNLGRGNAAPEPEPPELEDPLVDDEEDIFEPEEAGPDPVELIDQSMRTVSERMQGMSTTLDTIAQDRRSFEAKLVEMDERMRKLSSLTEMISNRYNPFIGSEMQPGAVEAAPKAAAAKPAFHFPAIRGESAASQRDGGAPLPPPPDWARDPDGTGSPLEFQHQLGVLALAEHLLAATTRVGALDLLGYYERLGWMGPQLRREILIAMEGLPSNADTSNPADRKLAAFRPFPAEFHARSLALLHRIRGSQLSEEDVALLRRDFARLAGE